jgi:hypothetical protein
MDWLIDEWNTIDWLIDLLIDGTHFIPQNVFEFI